MTRRGWALFATVLTVVAWLVLPDPLFLVAAIVVVVIGSGVAAAYWYEQAIRAEADRIHAVFEAEGYRLDLRDITAERDRFLARLSEVLDEHALCPAPVEVIDLPNIGASLTVVTDGPIPLQRKPEPGADEAKAIEFGLAKLRRSRGQS